MTSLISKNNYITTNPNITSGKGRATINGGYLYVKLYQTTLSTLNYLTEVDGLEINEALNMAKNQYGKAFEKLAEE